MSCLPPSLVELTPTEAYRRWWSSLTASVGSTLHNYIRGGWKGKAQWRFALQTSFGLALVVVGCQRQAIRNPDHATWSQLLFCGKEASSKVEGQRKTTLVFARKWLCFARIIFQNGGGYASTPIPLLKSLASLYWRNICVLNVRKEFKWQKSGVVVIALSCHHR